MRLKAAYQPFVCCTHAWPRKRSERKFTAASMTPGGDMERILAESSSMRWCCASVMTLTGGNDGLGHHALRARRVVAQIRVRIHGNQGLVLHHQSRRV